MNREEWKKWFKSSAPIWFWHAIAKVAGSVQDLAVEQETKAQERRADPDDTVVPLPIERLSDPPELGMKEGS